MPFPADELAARQAQHRLNDFNQRVDSVCRLLDNALLNGRNSVDVSLSSEVLAAVVPLYARCGWRVCSELQHDDNYPPTEVLTIRPL